MSQVSTNGAQAHPTVRLMSLGDLLPPFNLIGNCEKGWGQVLSRPDPGLCLTTTGIKALELAARIGLSNGAFEDNEEEAPAIVEEFYPEATSGAVSGQTVVPMPTKLTNKLAGNEMAKAA